MYSEGFETKRSGSKLKILPVYFNSGDSIRNRVWVLKMKAGFVHVIPERLNLNKVII